MLELCRQRTGQLIFLGSTGCSVPVYSQGQQENSLLIANFSSQPRAVLLATGSFWEGVDLSSAPLAGVVIDKLPFAPPNDPLLELRAASLSVHGIDPFSEDLLPAAVLRLRQGCGRLLRRSSDRGVIFIADPRLQSRDYGRAFIESLPAMLRSDLLADVKQFFARQNDSVVAN